MKLIIHHVVKFTTPDCEDYEDSFVIITSNDNEGVICIATLDDDPNGVDLGFVKAAVNRIFREQSFETTRSDFECAMNSNKLRKFMGHVNVFNEFFAHIAEDEDVLFGTYATQEEYDEHDDNC